MNSRLVVVVESCVGVGSWRLVCYATQTKSRFECSRWYVWGHTRGGEGDEDRGGQVPDQSVVVVLRVVCREWSSVIGGG
jgi:hypothetical protein